MGTYFLCCFLMADFPISKIFFIKYDVTFILLHLSSGMLDTFTSLPTQVYFLVVQRELKKLRFITMWQGCHLRNGVDDINRILSHSSLNVSLSILTLMVVLLMQKY